MAKVMTIESLKDLNHEEKREIWWQKSDYEEFRRTARIITKAMLQGGSEIWLQTTNRSSPRHGVSAVQAGSLAERQAAFQKGDVNAKKEYEETRDNWWHRFGHSRRGLEHLASIDEGRQRHVNVLAAKEAVLGEQRRQKIFGTKDASKLTTMYIQHSSWARDLALAAGESDADAVRSSFDHQRKSREFYLQKTLSRAKCNKNTPVVTKPMVGIPESRLDENTAPKLQFRKIQLKQEAAASPKSSTTTDSQSESVPEVSVPMAKKAAGFCATKEEVANMSAVLTGMGPIPKKA
jgi:hypothetical protein